jgi:hypothetical protein
MNTLVTNNPSVHWALADCLEEIDELRSKNIYVQLLFLTINSKYVCTVVPSIEKQAAWSCVCQTKTILTRQAFGCFFGLLCLDVSFFVRTKKE